VNENDTLNPTAPEGASGGQADVVDQPQATETPTEAAEQESVVGSHNPDFDLVEVGEDGEPVSEEPTTDAQPESADRADQNKESKQQQTHEENAAIRAARIRAQHEAEEAAAARTDAVIAGLGGLRNPYTGKPFASLKELSDYSANVLRAENEKRAKETGRSVDEIEEDAANRAFLSELRRRAQQQTQEAQQDRGAQQSDFIRQDLANFIEKHPDVDIAKLDANERFRLFCGSRYGREPLAQLYEEFQIIVGDAERSAVTRAEQKAQRSTGSGTPGGVTLTPAQKKDLDRWNAEHPEMAMTAKEFISR